MLDISPVLSYHPRCYNDLCLQGRGSVTTFKQVISMTHQSASTVNETPGAAVQRTPRRAFFPTEELYFEVHRICLKKKKYKINQEKTESAVFVDTDVELRQRKTPIPIWECPALYSLEEGGGLGRGLGGRHTFTGLLPLQLHVG